MLTPDYIEKLPNKIVKEFLILEEQVISEMAYRINKNLTLTETDRHQMKRLVAMGYDVEDIEREINKHIQTAAKDMDKLMIDIAKVSYESDQALYKKGGKDLIDLEDNIAMKQFIEQSTRESKDRILNLTNSTGFVNVQKEFQSVRDLYVSTLNQAFLQQATGLYDYNQAIRQAVNTLGDRGIVYIDFDNYRKYDIESHVRTSILTGVNQITGYMSLKNAEMMDQDLMELTAHAGARPSHSTWQGQIVDRTGQNSKYLTLFDIEYQEVTGFQGANCRHGWYPYFEGISSRAYSKEDLENIDPPDFEYDGKVYNAYEATQRQRYFERNMRRTKRKIIAYDRTDDRDMFTAESIKLRRLRDEYSSFSEAAKLREKHNRHYTYQYDRSIAQKARWKGKIR